MKDFRIFYDEEYLDKNGSVVMRRSKEQIYSAATERDAKYLFYRYEPIEWIGGLEMWPSIKRVERIN